MIIWRGWGVIPVLIGGFAMILFTGAASTFVPESLLPFSAGTGLLLAAVATWFVGVTMNVSRPQRTIDEWRQSRGAQLDHLVSNGTFMLGPGQPPPTSYAEARAQADWLFDQEARDVGRLKNRHTLFFVPMQYVAFAFAAIALVLFVVGIIGLV